MKTLLRSAAVIGLLVVAAGCGPAEYKAETDGAAAQQTKAMIKPGVPLARPGAPGGGAPGTTGMPSMNGMQPGGK